MKKKIDSKDTQTRKFIKNYLENRYENRIKNR